MDVHNEVFWHEKIKLNFKNGNMNCHEEAPEGISPKYRMKLGPGRDFMLLKVRIGSILIINK